MKYQDKISRTISQFVYSQLPATVHMDFEKPVTGKTDRTLFTRFIELYYEFLEKSVDFTIGDKQDEGITLSADTMLGEIIDDAVPGLHGELMRLPGYRDIDLVKTGLKSQLYDEYIVNYVEDTLGDKDRLLKISSLLNRAKGTELSYQILFRFMYNSVAKFVEPKKEIFKISSNRYHSETRMRIREISSLIEPSNILNFSEFAGNYIKGFYSGAKAYVISAEHDSGLMIKDTAPVSSVTLTVNGSGYKIPGAIDASGEGLILLGAGDSGYSDGQVDGVKVWTLGSGYEKFYRVELWENNETAWDQVDYEANREYLLPMSTFDENPRYSFAGWNIQKGIGRILSSDSVGGKTIYNVVPVDPEEVLPGYGQYWDFPEISNEVTIGANEIPIDLTIPPTQGFHSIPTYINARRCYQGSINAKSADGVITLHSDDRRLNVPFDNTTNNEELYVTTQELTLVFLGVENGNTEFAVGQEVEQAGIGARGIILSWDGINTMKVRLTKTGSQTVVPFQTSVTPPPDRHLYQVGTSPAKAWIYDVSTTGFVANDIVKVEPYTILTFTTAGANVGNFTLGETITWDNDSVTGVVTKWDSGTRTLHVARLTGAFSVSVINADVRNTAGTATGWLIETIANINKNVTAIVDSVSSNNLVLKDINGEGTDWLRDGDYIRTNREDSTGNYVSAFITSDPTLNSGVAKVNIQFVTSADVNIFAEAELFFTDSTGEADSGLAGWEIDKIYYQLKDAGLIGSSVVKSITEGGNSATKTTTYGVGTGLTVNIKTDSSGALIDATVQAPGSNYLVGEQVYVLSNTTAPYQDGNGDVRSGISGNNGLLVITGVDSFGAVTSVSSLTTVSENFGRTGSALPGDVNFDKTVDVLDMALASKKSGSGYIADKLNVSTSYGNGTGLTVEYNIHRGDFGSYEIDVDTLNVVSVGSDYEIDDQIYVLHDTTHTLNGVEVELEDIAHNSELILKLDNSSSSVNDIIFVDRPVVQGSATATISAVGDKKLMLKNISGIIELGSGFIYSRALTASDIIDLTNDNLLDKVDALGNLPPGGNWLEGNDYYSGVNWNVKRIEVMEEGSTVDINTGTSAKVVSSRYSTVLSADGTTKSSEKHVVLSTIQAPFTVGNTLDSANISGLHASVSDKKTHFTIKSIEAQARVADPKNKTRIRVSSLAPTTKTNIPLYGGSGTDATVDYTTDNLGRVNALTLNTEGKDYKVGDEVTVKSDTVLPATETGGNARKVKINKIQATGIAAKTYLKQSDGKVQGIASGLTLDYTVVAGAVTGVTINDAGDGYKEDESSTGGNVEEIYLVPTADDYLNGLNSTSTNAVVKIIDTDNIKVVESTDLVLRSEDIEGTFVNKDVIEAIDVDGNNVLISNSSNRLRAKVDPVVTGVDVTHGGIGYRVGEEAAALDATGIGGKVVVSNITKGPVDSLILDSASKGTLITDTSKISFSIRYFDIYGFSATKTGLFESYSDIESEYSLGSWNFNAGMSSAWPSGNVFTNLDKLAVIRGATSGYLGYVIKFENISTNLYRLWVVEEIPWEIIQIGRNYSGERLDLSYGFDPNDQTWEAGMAASAGWAETDLGYTLGTSSFTKPVATCYASDVKTIGPSVPQAIIEETNAGELVRAELIDEGVDYEDFPLAYVYNGTYAIDFSCKLYTYGNKIGSISDTKVTNHGTRYAGNEIAFPRKSPPGGNNGIGYNKSTADATLITGPIYKTEAKAIDNIGWTDGTQRLQDRLVYNKFAYMLESSVSPEVYLPMLKKTIHPVGFRTTPKYVYAEKPDSHTKTSLKVQVLGTGAGENVQTTT